MATSSKKESCPAAVKRLTAENEALRKTVLGLTDANNAHVRRSVDAELLRERVRDLETRLSDKKG